MIRTVSLPNSGRGWMDLLDNVGHILSSARIEAMRGRLVMIARKMAIRFFGATFEFPWSRVNILAATVILVWHGVQWVASYNMRERDKSLDVLGVWEDLLSYLW